MITLYIIIKINYQNIIRVQIDSAIFWYGMQKMRVGEIDGYNCNYHFKYYIKETRQRLLITSQNLKIDCLMHSC